MNKTNIIVGSTILIHVLMLLCVVVYIADRQNESMSQLRKGDTAISECIFGNIRNAEIKCTYFITIEENFTAYDDCWDTFRVAADACKEWKS